MSEITDLERRALANLPKYRTPDEHAEAEAHMREVNRYPDDWALAKTILTPDLAARLTADQYALNGEGGQAIGVDEIEEVLQGLSRKRPALCELTGYGWRMTEAGLNFLTGATED